MHRWIIGSGTAVMVAAVTTVIAPSAQAAVTATANCTSTQNFYYTLAPGETFTLTLGGSCVWVAPGNGNSVASTYGATGTEAILPAATWTSVTPPVVVIYTARTCGPAPASSDALFAARDIYPTATDQNGYGLTTIAPDCPLPTSPPVVLQQFGTPSSETCAEAAPPSLNWGGAGGGGWGNSWVEWMNEGKGGAVCTRTLVYSPSESRWTVG